ncbi:hypothetical protein [Dyadobacter sp. CY326]|uniref:hypothetical protein n=1 Tax=Dyadobacter sp. CY326 TaxID=2907300 RepID=UPI001F198A4F|nr:hypothetical protein [Dyadobacter sp. CY326]MCE7067977.1 hypothetical protein [Dyadobacter sp. CY326]
MNKVNLRKSVTFSVILSWIFALSCTNHVVPSKPDTLCSRISGLPRFYPCEFEILKIDVLSDSTGITLATATKEKPFVSIPLSRAASKGFYSGHNQQGWASYAAKMTIRRLSKPSFPTPTGYKIQFVRLDNDDNPYNEALYGTTTIKPEVAVEETAVINGGIMLEYFSTPTKVLTLNYIYSIKNPVTAQMLKDTPNNYELLRDQAEAHITMQVELTD